MRMTSDYILEIDGVEYETVFGLFKAYNERIEEIARLKKIEERLGADIGLIEQIDELEAKLDLVQVENGELKELLHTTRENAQSQIFELKKMLSEVVDDE